MNLVIFRERLGVLKKELGREFSRKANISRTAIYDWLGKTKRKGVAPRLDVFADFCEALCVDPVWLVVGVGPRELVYPLSVHTLADRLTQAGESLSGKVETESLRIWASGSSLPRLDALLSVAEAGDISIRWLLTGQGARHPFEGAASSTATISEPSVRRHSRETDEQSEAATAERLLSELVDLVELSIETHEWHAVGLIRRDLEALLTDIRRLYPELTRAHPSAKDGAA